MSSESQLDRAAQGELIRLARAAIESVVLHQPGPAEEELAAVRGVHPALNQPAGAFVTIYVNGELRGCLGEIEAENPLREVLIRCARRAPRHDYRFAAVAADELETLDFKVSVLSVPQLLDSAEKIQIGAHGLIVRYDGHVGLLLPEVPVEHGWDVPAFLKHLWIKAGIEPSVPTAAAQLWFFTSQVINSRDFPTVSSPEG